MDIPTTDPTYSHSSTANLRMAADNQSEAYQSTDYQSQDHQSKDYRSDLTHQSEMPHQPDITPRTRSFPNIIAPVKTIASRIFGSLTQANNRPNEIASEGPIDSVADALSNVTASGLSTLTSVPSNVMDPVSNVVTSTVSQIGHTTEDIMHTTAQGIATAASAVTGIPQGITNIPNTIAGTVKSTILVIGLVSIVFIIFGVVVSLIVFRYRLDVTEKREKNTKLSRIENRLQVQENSIEYSGNGATTSHNATASDNGAASHNAMASHNASTSSIILHEINPNTVLEERIVK